MKTLDNGFYLVLLRNKFLSQSDTCSGSPLLICPFALLGCIRTVETPSLCFLPHPQFYHLSGLASLSCCAALMVNAFFPTSYSFTAAPLQGRTHTSSFFPVQASVSASVGVWMLALFFAFNTMGYFQSPPLSCLWILSPTLGSLALIICRIFISLTPEHKTK